MDDKLSVILQCIHDVLETRRKGCLPTPVKLHELSEMILYNYETKCYDIVYGLDLSDFETDEIIRICNSNDVTYEYRGYIKNSSQQLLFGKRKEDNNDNFK